MHAQNRFTVNICRAGRLASSLSLSCQHCRCVQQMKCLKNHSTGMFSDIGGWATSASQTVNGVSIQATPHSIWRQSGNAEIYNGQVWSNAKGISQECTNLWASEQTITSCYCSSNILLPSMLWIYQPDRVSKIPLPCVHPFTWMYRHLAKNFLRLYFCCLNPLCDPRTVNVETTDLLDIFGPRCATLVGVKPSSPDCWEQQRQRRQIESDAWGQHQCLKCNTGLWKHHRDIQDPEIQFPIQTELTTYTQTTHLKMLQLRACLCYSEVWFTYHCVIWRWRFGWQRATVVTYNL